MGVLGEHKEDPGAIFSKLIGAAEKTESVIDLEGKTGGGLPFYVIVAVGANAKRAKEAAHGNGLRLETERKLK